jgi:hypothetical protein
MDCAELRTLLNFLHEHPTTVVEYSGSISRPRYVLPAGRPAARIAVVVGTAPRVAFIARDFASLTREQR